MSSCCRVFGRVVTPGLKQLRALPLPALTTRAGSGLQQLVHAGISQTLIEIKHKCQARERQLLLLRIARTHLTVQLRFWSLLRFPGWVH